jgi:hypothetical protein
MSYSDIFDQCQLLCPFLSFVYQINYLPEMAIVRLCNVPVQLKLAADVANFCGQWTYIEYLVIVLFKCSEV